MWQKNDTRSWWLDSLLLVGLLCILYFLMLGTRPLFVPDEGRYAEIAREMITTGNYITPHLNNIKYFEKPALFYWLVAFSLKLFGINIWAARLPGVLLGITGCLFTYITTRRLYDRATGILAAAVLGTSTLYFIMSHMVSLDLPVTVFIAGSLYAVLLGLEQPVGTSRRSWCWGAAVFAALAVLTKGLIGIVFPGLIILSWIACTNQWRLLRELYLPSSIIVFLIVVAPWHLLVGHRNPEFFYFYFIEQQFLRYTQKEIGHYQPVWFFIPTFIAGFFPWIVFLPQTLWHSVKQMFLLRFGRGMDAQINNKKNLNRSFATLRMTTSEEAKEDVILSAAKDRYSVQICTNKQTHLDIFFLLWFILIFLFFSFSKSKLIPYILPIFPPIAILTARYIIYATRAKKYLGLIAGYIGLLIATALLGFAVIKFIHLRPLLDPKLIRIAMSIGIGTLAIGTLIALLCLRDAIFSFTTLTFTAAIFLLTLLTSFPAVDTRTILPLAQILQPYLTADSEIINYGQYYQDLPFYLGRRITIVNWQNELTFGMAHQDTRGWMINDQVFWQRWNSEQRVFVIMSKENYLRLQQTHSTSRFFLLGSTLTNVLLTNQKI